MKENNAGVGIINGTQGTVIGIDNKTGEATIKTSIGDIVKVSKERAEALDYSYARTVHSVQGATAEGAIIVGEASRVATAEAAYVGGSREKKYLTIITDNIASLCKSWSKHADKQTALQASRSQTPETIEEIRQARLLADRDLGQAGDLAEKRSLEVEPLEEQGHAGKPEIPGVHEMEMEIGE
jgi:ATP-dependent exoDNAse (exonuclease V) alpha subunit